MFRSENMVLCQIFIHKEAVYNSLAELGEKGLVQFKDLNVGVSIHQRKFVARVRRYEELERKLRVLYVAMNRENISIPHADKVPLVPDMNEAAIFEKVLDSAEEDEVESKTNMVKLKSNLLNLRKYEALLDYCKDVFAEPLAVRRHRKDMRKIVDTTIDISDGHLIFVAGVLDEGKYNSFEKIIWRLCRGNAFIRHSKVTKFLEDPNTGEQLHKTCVAIFCQGDELKERINRVCNGYMVKTFNVPTIPAEIRAMLEEIREHIRDLVSVIKQVQSYREARLRKTATKLDKWRMKIIKVKAIYHTMNLFNYDINSQCYVGECWVPVIYITAVQRALIEGTKKNRSVHSILHIIETNEDPPTFIQTNIFTSGFQNLIDAYGCASYREVNPALPTIITFPFLFSIMFGDVGHALIMIVFAWYMIRCENEYEVVPPESEIYRIMYYGRYIILLMGIFSIFTGLIYNDVFCKGMNLFGCRWRVVDNITTIMQNEFLTLDPVTSAMQSPYPVGIDPIWHMSTNKIIFLNSYKMKMSICFGVLHMTYGVFLSNWNFVHFRHKINILLEFLPQIIFLTLLFSYLVFLIVFKWIYYGPKKTETKYQPTCAPSVLIIFINMMLFKETPVAPDCSATMYEGQIFIQQVFVLVAVSMIPIMLLGKPFYIMNTRNEEEYEDDEDPISETGIQLSEDVLIINEDVEGYDPKQQTLLTGDVPSHIFKLESEGKRFEVDYLDGLPPPLTESEQSMELEGFVKIIKKNKKENKIKIKKPKKQKQQLSAEKSVSHIRFSMADEEDGSTVWERFRREMARTSADFLGSVSSVSIIKHEEPISEIFIHTAIHTIEYVLNCVSHTASYLRLWALSLAHARKKNLSKHLVPFLNLFQILALLLTICHFVVTHLFHFSELSEVVWSLFQQGLKNDSFVGSVTTYLMFYVWATFSVAILVLMEGLSAFLHTLRLHWVEFMSKFYTGLGHPFLPFHFKRILTVDS